MKYIKSLLLVVDLIIVSVVDSLAQNATGNLGGHDYVDLGLPSGTLWATCNVGADSPQDYGTYYAWGESSIDSYKLSSTEKFNCAEGKDSDCTDISGGTHDAAYVDWGESWRTPSEKQFQELIYNCQWTWNGSGYIIKSQTGASIFLPATGEFIYGYTSKTGRLGRYITSTPIINSFLETYKAYLLHIDQYEKTLKKHDIYVCSTAELCGYSVRPVTNKDFIEKNKLSQTLDKNERQKCNYDSLSNVKYDKDNFSICQLIGQSLFYVGTESYENGLYIVEMSESLDSSSSFYRITLKNNLTGKRSIILIDGMKKFKEMNSSWVVEGHIKKLKQQFIGKQFYYPDDLQNYRSFLSIFTEEPIFAANSYWTCVDVTTHKKQNNSNDYGSAITLVFKNSEGTMGYCFYEDNYGNYYGSESNSMYSKRLCGRYMTLDDKEKKEQAEDLAWKGKMNKLRKLYGKYADQIAVGQVDIGMTKAMCREAIGEPTTINTTRTAYGTHEQWVYESKYGYKTKYVYFENGKITAIQD